MESLGFLLIALLLYGAAGWGIVELIKMALAPVPSSDRPYRFPRMRGAS